MVALTVADLSQVATNGSGVFDVLMRSVKAHLDQEFLQNRIKGPEYSTVYLGSLTLAMQTALQFLLQKDKLALEASLLEKQLLLADKELLIKEQQVLIAVAELGIAQAKLANVPKEGLLLDAQVAKVTQETSNLTAEALNIPIQGTVLTAQKCKLDAEFDLVVSQTTKTTEEIALLAQKVATEKAQTLAVGVDPDSVIGKQKALYTAQTTGFTRDAEQKAAKLMADTWSVRRTTDEATQANSTNKLDDAAVGRAIDKLLTGVGA